MKLDKTAAAALMIAVLGGAMGPVSGARPARAAAEAPSVPGPDKQFLDDTYSINQGEIVLGQLAKQRGTTRPVMDFAERMITDHSKALDASKQVASKLHLTLPSTLDPPTKALYDQLSTKSGRGFDTAYLDAMVNGHESAVHEFEYEIETGRNAEIKSYARVELPMLREHLARAHRAQQAEHTGVAEPQRR